jgi:hypothetical protein
MTADPFNEIDAMIFSLLSYVNYLPVFPSFSIEKKVSINDIVADFEKKNIFKKAEKDLIEFEKECLNLLKLLSTCDRYSDIKLTAYRETFKVDKTVQFGAITFILEDGTLVLSYRGTDNSLIGWKEDFAMSFDKTVGSQKCGLAYINEVKAINSNPIIITGHSKGGNVAVYSGIKSDEVLQDRILKIYNFDGPGFNSKAVVKKDYESLGIEKIITLVPQSSIVGILLQHEEPYSVVYSSKKTGIFQHYPMSWEVDKKSFKRIEEFKNSSLYFDETIHSFLEHMNEDELALFVDTLFDTVQAGGAINLKDLIKNPAKTIGAMRKFYNDVPPKTRKQIETFIKAFIKISIQVSTDGSKKQLGLNKIKKQELEIENTNLEFDGLV